MKTQPAFLKNYTLNTEIKPAANIASFSRITRHDKKLLQAAVHKFRPDSENYEDSWGYMIQATRNKGFKWYDPSNGNLIFFGRKPHQDNILVVPNFFADVPYLVRVLNQINLIDKPYKVILKNINPEAVSNFIPYNFHTYKEDDYWLKEAPFDDQTFPQLIIDLQLLYQAQGKKYHKLRNLLNKKPQYSIRPYRNADKNAVSNIIVSKDALTKHPSNRMYFNSHKMYPAADLGKHVIIDERTGELIGFTATSDITKRTSALVAAIFKPEAKVASIWGIYHTLIAKYREGFRIVNLGGYEFLGSYIFMKEKFRPVEELHRTHLVYTPVSTNKKHEN